MVCRFISMEPCTKDEYKSIITLETSPSFVARFFGIKPHILKFYGGSTVWYTYPEFVRIPSMERMLCNIWTREKFNTMPAQK